MAERFFPLEAGSAAWNSTVSQTWEVTQAETASGRRRAICNQLYAKNVFNITFPALSDADVQKLLGFFSKCKGTLLPFWYKDYKSRVEMQELHRDEKGEYVLFVNCGGYITACERVDDVRVYINGTETYDFVVAGGALSVPAAKDSDMVVACYDYYFYVRFGGDLSITQTFANINNVSLQLVTVR